MEETPSHQNKTLGPRRGFFAKQLNPAGFAPDGYTALMLDSSFPFPRGSIPRAGPKGAAEPQTHPKKDGARRGAASPPRLPSVPRLPLI